MSSIIGLPQAAIPRAASSIQSGLRFRKNTGVFFIIMAP
jgi:hypothetical protein